MKSFNEYVAEKTLSEGLGQFTSEEKMFLDSELAQKTYIPIKEIPQIVYQSLFAKNYLREPRSGGNAGGYVQLSGDAARYVNQLKMVKNIFGR